MVNRSTSWFVDRWLNPRTVKTKFFFPKTGIRQINTDCCRRFDNKDFVKGTQVFSGVKALRGNRRSSSRSSPFLAKHRHPDGNESLCSQQTPHSPQTKSVTYLAQISKISKIFDDTRFISINIHFLPTHDTASSKLKFLECWSQLFRLPELSFIPLKSPQVWTDT